MKMKRRIMHRQNGRIRIRALILAALCLIAAGLACGPQQAEPTPLVIVATPTPSGEVQPTVPPSPTVPPQPTSTPVPGGCINGMQFLADVTVPDGTVFGPNEPFVKTWRVRNTGSCDWVGYHIVFDHGEPMGTMDQLIPDTPAGQEVEISVEMTSPGGAGNYTGAWQVRSPDGANLGNLTCAIVVEGGEPPTEEPTGHADLVIEDASVFSPMPTAPGTVQISITIRNVGDGQAGAFTVVWFPHGASDEVGCSIGVAGLSPGISLVEECSYTYAGHGEMHWRAVVDAYNEVDESTNEDNNEWRGTISIVAYQVEPTTVTLQSLPAEDGYVRGVTGGESVSLSGDVRVGDGIQKRGQQAFFSFDISGILQGATIQEAVLDLSNHTIAGAPFGEAGLGQFRVYPHQYGELGLEDYVVGWPPEPFTTLTDRPGILTPKRAVQELVNQGASRFQIRLQFQYITDLDGQQDGLTFPEGGPALTISYVP